MKKAEQYVHLYTPEGEAWQSRGEGEIPWEIYPRPHLRRDSFLCLNGRWEFSAVADGEEPRYDESILVPFVPESILSGIGRTIPAGARLCYRRSFCLPDGFVRARVILHVDAADQIARVVLNGQSLGEHRGGYDRFSLDVTDALREQNVLEIFVTDELENHVLPYGKQRKKRGGMWYTPISGIWQSVWLESVPEVYIRELKFESHGAEVTVLVEPSLDGHVTVHGAAEQTVPLVAGQARFSVSDPIPWSPEQPHLYDVTVRVGEDEVHSYFALRELSVREIGGIPRLCLNGDPYFFHGLLDQGYFSDGIFLPASPEGYERDILTAKRLGFNMLRKHIKVEPEQFYYACDRLGIVVFQDMVNNGTYSFLRDTALPTVGLRRTDDRRLHRDEATRCAFLDGMERTVRTLSFHPSVCYWTIFNEGWGQFDHTAVYARLKELDDTRFVDSVSGWFLPRKQRAAHSDVESHHVYFKPVRLTGGEKPLVLSEFGGYSYKVAGHCFNLRQTYGYKSFSEREEFEDALERLYRDEILPAVRAGLCAAVYTQLSDVEDETNGLMSYDRRIEKVDAKRMRAIAKVLLKACR